MRFFGKLTSVAIVVLLVCLVAPAHAQEIKLRGKWATRLGVVRLYQEGRRVTGKLIWVSKTCPLRKGDIIIKGVLLEDSLAGKWRYCLRGGATCRGQGWAPMVMLVARGGRVLSGAAHFPVVRCAIGGRLRKDAVVARKLRPRPRVKRPSADAGVVVPPAVAAGWRDENGQPLEEEVKPLNPDSYAASVADWRSAMEQGAAQMNAGFFERARKLFRRASELDPTRPEAYNGVGVTYYARNDYEQALTWYKKALEVDSSFGDAFYNMACIYALLGKKELAFRYLNIAALNGYTGAEAMRNDNDLRTLHQDPRFQEILAKMQSDN